MVDTKINAQGVLLHDLTFFDDALDFCYEKGADTHLNAVSTVRQQDEDDTHSPSG